MSTSAVAALSNALQVSEEAFRLLLSLFCCVLSAIFYRAYFLKYVRDKNEASKLYFLLLGLSIGYFNFGFDTIHSLIAAMVTFIVLCRCPRSVLFTWGLIIAHFCYLFTGYWMNLSKHYVINWTTPHCVLVLKLTAIIIDLSKPKRRKEPIDFLSFMSFIYFPATFLIGPQVSYDHYLKFTSHLCLKDSGFLNSYTSMATKKFIQSQLYFVVSFLGSTYVSDEMLSSKYFAEFPFWQKMLLLGLWGRFVLYKYVACWLLVETAAILFGLAFSPEDNQFQKCQNIVVDQFENTLSFSHYIKSFNISTNNWVFAHIYTPVKKQMGPIIGQLTSLLFLTYWHGFSSGYLMTFFMEFMVIFFERNLTNICGHWSIWSHKTVQSVLKIVLRLYTLIFMGYCLVPFVFLTFDRYWPIYRSVHFAGFLMFFPWPFFVKLLRSK